MYHTYVSVPVPPDSEDEKVTEFPTSAGFWLLLMNTVGLGLIFTVTDALLCTPTESVIVTVRVYEPEESKEYEKSWEADICCPFRVQEYEYPPVPPEGVDENSTG